MADPKLTLQQLLEKQKQIIAAQKKAAEENKVQAEKIIQAETAQPNQKEEASQNE